MRFLRLIAAALCAAMLCGCGASAPRLPEYAPGEENRLVVYTSHKEEVYNPIIREFEERTGIWVEVVTGGTNELLDRIAEEASAPKADVMFGGGVESLESHRDSFAPYQCAGWDQIAAQFRSADSRWIPFSALPVVLIYNTKLVDPVLLKGWQDLSRPEFRGRIAFADPTKSGSSFTALVTMLCAGGSAEALAQALDYSQFSSSGDVLSAVAKGTCLVGITLEETALQRIAAGANIAMVYPEEGTSAVPDGTAVVLGAPHERNARLFVDFTVSYDVQQLLSSRLYRRSVRMDVPSDPSLLPLEQLPRVTYGIQWASDTREEILALWDSAINGEGGK